MGLPPSFCFFTTASLDPRDTIIVFAKLPVPVKVKTRLLGPLTAEEAAELHLACLRDTIALVNSLPSCRKWLMPAGNPSECLQLAGFLALPARWRVTPQRGHELGTRLSQAFLDAFRSGARSVVVIGTDTPWMGRPRLRQAFEALSRAEVVIGPAADGGYYLIGARRHAPMLFKGIPWGTGGVLHATLLAIGKARVRYRQLRRDFDLDRPQDLERLGDLLRDSDCDAPELGKWLGRRNTTGESSRRPTLSRPRRKQRTYPE